MRDTDFPHAFFSILNLDYFQFMTYSAYRTFSEAPTAVKKSSPSQVPLRNLGMTPHCLASGYTIQELDKSTVGFKFCDEHPSLRDITCSP